MTMLLVESFLLLFCLVKAQKPNVIIIMADDMGINDVSFRGSNQILTPNIDALAYHGVILDRFYTPAMCTPSRAALLTGKHPIHTGMQHYVIPSDEPWGLPLNYTIMPEIFRGAGYSTNLIGKWHLGFYKRGFTPTFRGFDYHFGYYGGYVDYYDHSLIMLDRNYSRGYDMRRNLDINYETNGTYATDLFNDEAVNVIRNHNKSKPLFLFVSHLAPHAANENDPMQAPEDEIEKQNHISDPIRREYAAMVSKLDEGVGKIVNALYETKMLSNSIVIFFSDNGAPTHGMHSNGGSNYPLKGQKNSPWEGGVRTISAIWSPLIKERERVFKQPIYSTDLLPTLAYAAGIKLDPKLQVDGENIWDQLVTGVGSKSRKILHNIDKYFAYSVYMNGPWKYVNGTTNDGAYDGWWGETANETNPRSTNYPQEIFQSFVSKAIRQLFDYSSNLTAQKIENLRKHATIICSKLNILEKNENTTKYHCNPLESPCLFNVETDPCEYYNLAWKYPTILNQLKQEVEKYSKTALPSVRKPRDPKCDPALHNYTWSWWQEDEMYEERSTIVTFVVISAVILVVLCVITGIYVYRNRVSLKLKLPRI